MALNKVEHLQINFQAELLTKAFNAMDTDKIAKELAKTLEQELISDARDFIESDINFAKLLKNELMDQNTKVGRNFHAVMAQISNDMLQAIRNPATKG